MQKQNSPFGNFINNIALTIVFGFSLIAALFIWLPLNSNLSSLYTIAILAVAAFTGFLILAAKTLLHLAPTGEERIYTVKVRQVYFWSGLLNAWVYSLVLAYNHVEIFQTEIIVRCIAILLMGLIAVIMLRNMKIAEDKRAAIAA